MAIPPANTQGQTDADAGASPDSRSLSAPRWVRVFGAFAALFFAVFVLLHLLGGGLRHHTLSGMGGNRASSAGAEVHAPVDGAQHGRERP